MNIDVKELEKNVNLFALDPNFKNSELHYIVAQDEKTFRFTTWEEVPTNNEKKYYCYLTQEPLHIPAGNIDLKQSYVLKDEPVYTVTTSATDLFPVVDKVKKDTSAKCIRMFNDSYIPTLLALLQDKYGKIEQHVVTSSQGQHMLVVLDEIEISISATMIYLRNKTPISQTHYENVKEEGQEKVNQA